MAKLVCEKCGYETSVPMHCGKEMHREDDKLVCWMGPACAQQDIPTHCDQPMNLVE